MRIIPTAILVGFLFLSGCTKDVTETPPLNNIVVQEVKVPIATCPQEVDQLKFPVRPYLVINDLKPTDNKNYTKIGTAYMQSISDLGAYADKLEQVAHGAQDICRSVNTPLSGK